MSAQVMSLPVADSDSKTTRLLQFSMLIMLGCLVLQRFGLPLGSSALSIMAPIGLGLAGLAFVNGLLAFDRTRLLIWLAMLTWIIMDSAVRAVIPSPVGNQISWTSLFGFVVFNSFAVFSFSKPIDEKKFFTVINYCFAIIAIAGVAQFAAQFVGVKLFKFAGILPGSVLIEPYYNVEVPFGSGSLFKSNGLFLLEPSIMSQMMAFALIIEILALRRSFYLMLFTVGMLISISGSGMLMLLAFVALVTLSMGPRGFGLAAGTALIVGFSLLALYFLAPNIFALFQGRLDEFSLPGTSGHMRFVTPFWAAHDMLGIDPLGWLFGCGPGISEHPGRYIAYDYNMNPPMKLLIEYGVPVLVLYALLLVAGRKTAIQRGLLAPTLVLILVDGGYQQTPFILFPAMLISLVATLEPSRKIRAQSIEQARG